MTTTSTSNTNDINYCYDLIDSLKSLIENNKQSSGGHISETSDGRGHMTPIRTGIDSIAVSELLNEVLIGGKIKKIAHSENKKLISSFYKTLQDIYIELEKLSFGFTPEIEGLLKQIRSSFAKALPNEDLTKKEIEDNIKIIHNREQNNRDKNKRNEENRKIKEIITGNITKISILLLGVALCYLWGKTILLIYVLIICVGLLTGIISQLRNKTKNEKDTLKPVNKTHKTSNQTDEESLQECFKLIQSLSSITETYSEIEACHFNEKGEATRFQETINVEKASHFFKDVLTGDTIKTIANSKKQDLISDFYKTLQEVLYKIETSRGSIDGLPDLLKQIRNSFCIALPDGNKTKIENNIQIIQEQEINKRNNVQKSNNQPLKANAVKNNRSYLPNEIIDIAFKIGAQTYSNFLTSFKANAKDYGKVSKFEIDLYSFFICDMLSYSVYKSEKLRAEILNTFLRRINDKYTVLLSGNSSVIKIRLEKYFKTYTMILNQSSENNGFKSIEEQLLYVLLNTSQETQIQENYAPKPQDMFEKMTNTKRFIVQHNEYFNGLFEELERKVSNYAP
ncbi:hypothetical protein ACT3CE_15750 [Marinifilum sp. RC60d5]|uniref:hypothetical protein n=1 Tax=Marinifilum sp. RC60d5 TaxID=3458414 RepID=UPI004035F98B